MRGLRRGLRPIEPDDGLERRREPMAKPASPAASSARTAWITSSTAVPVPPDDDLPLALLLDQRNLERLSPEELPHQVRGTDGIGMDANGVRR